MKGNLSNNYVGRSTNQLTRSHEAKSVNGSNVRGWIFAGVAVVTAITGGVATYHRISKDRLKREDDAKKEKSRKEEELEKRAYQEKREKDHRDYQEAQTKEKREYLHQQELERREFYTQWREKESQRRMEAAETSRKFKLEMKKLGVSASVQPAPAKCESMTEFSQREHTSIEELRIVGNVIHSGERGIIFGGTGQCKSFLIWQIGIDLASGKSNVLFPTNPTTNAPMPVYILDGEMSDEDINDRYPQKVLAALPNLHRLTKIKTGTISLINEVRSIAERTQDPECAIIIDNLNSLCHQATAKQIGELYDALKVIGEEAKERGTKITMIIVTHERKHNDGASLRLLSIDDIYGSSFSGDFAEFAIGIAPTKVEEVKRIKVVKARKRPKGKDVILARLIETPYKKFEYLQEVPEEEAIAMDAEDIQPRSLRQGDITLAVAKQMKALYRRGEKGRGWKAVGKKFGVSGTAVKNALKRNNLL